MKWPNDGEEIRAGERAVAWSQELRDALDATPMPPEREASPWRWEEGSGAPWSLARGAPPRWRALWDEQGWEGPCLRVCGYDFGQVGAMAFEWLRLGGRAFVRVGSGIMQDRDEIGGCPPAFVHEYRLASPDEWPAPWQSVRGLDLDGEALVLALRENEALEREALEPSKSKGPRL